MGVRSVNEANPFYSDSILSLLMLMYRVHGAILIGIFLVSIISWPRNSVVTYFPYTEEGEALFSFFKKVVTFQPLDRIGNVLSVRSFLLCFLNAWERADVRWTIVQLWFGPCVVRSDHFPLRRYPRYVFAFPVVFGKFLMLVCVPYDRYHRYTLLDGQVRWSA